MSLTIVKIKDLIEEYNIENDYPIKKYKSLRKPELLDILKKYKIPIPKPKAKVKVKKEKVIKAPVIKQPVIRKKKEDKDDYDQMTLPIIKDLIAEYNIENDNAIKKYKSLRKSELIDILKAYKIDISKVQIPQRGKNTKEAKPYLEKEQEEFKKKLEVSERYKTPLEALNMYKTNEGTEEYLKLQKHQKEFIKQFIFSNVNGAIVFHGVGSGKTLTAVVSSYLYLKMYPTNKVYIISPSALLYNFSDEMIKYGLNPRDNRYNFFTYDKFINMDKQISDCLVIIDEAHNFRSEIIQKNDPITEEQFVASNKRGYAILENATKNAHKVILLTGTLFVNKIYDIENLLAMSEQRGPIPSTIFNDMLKSADNYPDYFNYKISYYPPIKNEYFPTAYNHYEAIVMSEDFLKKYEEIESQDKMLTGYALEHFEKYRENKTNKKKTSSEKTFNIFEDEKDENSFALKTFYNGVINASNSIDGLNNPKIKFIIDKIVDTPDEKFIVYSSLYDAGIQLLKVGLKNNNIKFTVISGKETARQKNNSKILFNTYNFNGKYPFKDAKIDSPEFQDKTVRVLLITRAGAEGVSTINCNNIILLDAQWNEALAEQIIARAIRYKSHFGLPEGKRYVNVYRLMLIKKSEKQLVKNTFQNPDFKDWKELLNDIQSGFINEDYEEKNYRNMKDKVRQNELKQFYKIPRVKDDNTGYIVSKASIDLKLMVISHAKQENIDEFVKLIGNGIQQFEKYTDSKFLKFLMSKEHENMTEEEQIRIYKEGYTDLNQDIISNTYRENLLFLALGTRKTTREKHQVMQQFFTNEFLVNEIYKYSEIMNDDRQIKVLEPTAGIGNLILPLLELDKDLTIDLVEYDPENRKILEKLISLDKVVLNLEVQPDFLKTTFKEKYDYIFMNPPFNLRKSENAKLKKSVKDIDFVLRAFVALKIDGELIAIVGPEAKNTEMYRKFENSGIGTIDIIPYQEQKFSKGREDNENIKINVDIMIIKKLSNDLDNKILISQQKFYGRDKETKEQQPLLQLLDVVDIPDSKEIKNAINKSLIK
jgi:predicted RNA methylase